MAIFQEDERSKVDRLVTCELDAAMRALILAVGDFGESIEIRIAFKDQSGTTRSWRA